MSAYKKFNEQLFNENDVRARLVTLSYLDSQGMYAVENDDHYGPDLVVYRGLTPAYYVEVEVKRVWSGNHSQFQWDSVQLPVRKEKFLNAGKPIEFWILNAECNCAIIIPDYVLANCPKVEVSNKYIPKGELFWQVPITKCILVDL